MVTAEGSWPEGIFRLHLTTSGTTPTVGTLALAGEPHGYHWELPAGGYLPSASGH
jgi:hypothetical protein